MHDVGGRCHRPESIAGNLPSNTSLACSAAYLPFGVYHGRVKPTADERPVIGTEAPSVPFDAIHVKASIMFHSLECPRGRLPPGGVGELRDAIVGGIMGRTAATTGVPGSV